MRYGCDGNQIDHDSELMVGLEDGFGECEACGEPFNQDGARCDCKHVVRLLVDDGSGRYVWRTHSRQYTTDGEANAAGEQIKLLNNHVKGFVVGQELPEEDDDEDDEEDVEDGDDEYADDMEDDDEEDEIDDAMLGEVWLRR